MMWIHISSGMAALLAGFIAFYVRKGGGTHRSSGRVFGYAMFVMTITGALIAILLHPNPANIVAASTSFYLVATGWLTASKGPYGVRWRQKGLCLFGFVTGGFGIAVATLAFRAPSRSFGEISAEAIVIFSAIALLGASADLRLLCGRMLNGSQRVLRHLWRMGLALLIATTSYFFGQSDQFPDAVRETGALSIPVVAVAATLLFWIGRQLLKSRHGKGARLSEGPSAPRAP